MLDNLWSGSGLSSQLGIHGRLRSFFKQAIGEILKYKSGLKDFHKRDEP